jgi:hypothetical protein
MSASNIETVPILQRLLFCRWGEGFDQIVEKQLVFVEGLDGQAFVAAIGADVEKRKLMNQNNSPTNSVEHLITRGDIAVPNLLSLAGRRFLTRLFCDNYRFQRCSPALYLRKLQL